MKFDKLKSITGKVVDSIKDFCSSQKKFPVFQFKPESKKTISKGLTSVNYDGVIYFLEKSKAGNLQFNVLIE